MSIQKIKIVFTVRIELSLMVTALIQTLGVSIHECITNLKREVQYRILLLMGECSKYGAKLE